MVADGLTNDSTIRPRAAGRQRDPGLDTAILGAVSEQLSKVGYDALSVEEVARRAGVAKTTLLRRWRTKGQLVVATVLWLTDGSNAHCLSDTGSLRGDLIAEVERIATVMTPDFVAQMTGLFLAMRRDPALARIFHEQLIAPQQAQLAVLLARAVDRGELDGAADDLALFDSVIPSMILGRRFVLDRPVDADFAVDLVDSLIIPALSAAGNRTSPTQEN